MKTMNLSGRTITTDKPAFVMGILNATPDSFWSGSRGGLNRAMTMIEQGADIIDIGGESTRPGSDYVSEEEEISRIVPVIKAIRKESDIPISVDTRKSAVMKAAFEEGADILNDISALEDDENMASFCAKENLPVILMHKRGTPGTMQLQTSYPDIFSEISEYLQNRCDYALKYKIKKDRIWIDPGIGFGKNAEGNFKLIKDCGKLCGGQYPVLMALSRKSCIGQATGKDASGRLAGTIAADLMAVIGGASMIRVHDVAEAVDSLKVYERIKNS